MTRAVEDTPAESDNVANLADMTKSQLLNFAKENGVEGVNGSMRKADIMSVIEGVTGNADNVD